VAESISIIVPCFNEAGNVASVVDDLVGRLEPLGRESELILVDDGSRDETWACICEAAEKHARVRGVRQMRNYGQSLAYQAGIENARGDLVVLYSADQEVSSSYLLEVIAKLDEGNDFVNTRRMGRWGGGRRAFSSRVGNALINWISGLHLEDRGSGLKGMRANLARTMKFYGEMHRFIPDYASLHTDRLVEIDTDFQDRTYGKSAYKGSIRSLSVFLDLITVAFLIHCAKRPFPLSPGRVFGFTGLIIGMLGVGVTGWLSLEKLLLGATLADRPLFLVAILASILGVMMVMLGVTGEMTMRAYYESGARKTHLNRESVGLDTAIGTVNASADVVVDDPTEETAAEARNINRAGS
jgi:glycosyltransferase involved in cell wall biosynthesis